MSSGYAANHAYTVTIEQARMIAPKAMAYLDEQILHGKFEDEDGAPYSTIEQLCEGNQHGEFDFTDEIKTFEKLAEEETGGLSFNPYFNNQADEGDIYDEVDGPFFMVFGVTELTPAGKKWRDMISDSLWVHFG